MKIGKYRKVIVAAVGLAVVVADQFLGVGNEVSTAIISLGTALGVYAVPNEG